MAENNKNIDNSEEIILGSGDLFLMEYSGAIPADDVVEAEGNRAGNVKGGATLEYSTENQTVEDDQGRVKKTIITKETVKLKTGLITWCMRYIQAIIATAKVDTTSKAGHCVTKLGGLQNQGKKKWLWRFVHTFSDGRKLRVTCTGKNVGSISLKFDPSNPTTCDAEINADALDKDGTLVIVDRELPSDAQTVTEG